MGQPLVGYLIVGGSTGITNVNVLPLPFTPSLSTDIVPPCASTSLLLNASPRPVPS